MASTNTIERKSPTQVNGIRRIQVGCGPHNILSDWWNVDIRGFQGVDEVMDVTKPWPWQECIEYIYGEHFIEHLELEGAISFLRYSLDALVPGGEIRLSTPSLEWVLMTHFNLHSHDPDKKITDTMNTNRAFHGWGHKFLYSKSFLEKLLLASGFIDIKFYSCGESDTKAFRNVERHGGFNVVSSVPSVWCVEGLKPSSRISIDKGFLDRCHAEYIRYVAAGH